MTRFSLLHQEIVWLFQTRHKTEEGNKANFEDSFEEQRNFIESGISWKQSVRSRHLFYTRLTFLLVLQQLLNCCFDDIEKFVARLQQAAEAFRELDRRRAHRPGRGPRAVGGESGGVR